MIACLYIQQTNNLVMMKNKYNCFITTNNCYNSVFYEPWQTVLGGMAILKKIKEFNLGGLKASQRRWFSKPRSKSLVDVLRRVEETA